MRNALCVMILLTAHGLNHSWARAERTKTKKSLHHRLSRRRGSRLSEAYRKQRDEWHARDTSTSITTAPPLPLVLVSNHTGLRVELKPLTELGGFSQRDLELSRSVFSPAAGIEHEVDPRLLNKLYVIQRHFNAPYLRIISGYRQTRQGSRHAHGRAADIVVPGTRDVEVALFCQSLGFTGVGLYPVSGFVHVDVRAKSFYWIDTSPPGVKRKRLFHATDAAAANAADEAALQRGEQPFIETEVDENQEDAD